MQAEVLEPIQIDVSAKRGGRPHEQTPPQRIDFLKGNHKDATPRATVTGSQRGSSGAGEA
jgi:hypothetical protein